jgi:hypothetical protein
MVFVWFIVFRGRMFSGKWPLLGAKWSLFRGKWSLFGGKWSLFEGKCQMRCPRGDFAFVRHVHALAEQFIFTSTRERISRKKWMMGFLMISPILQGFSKVVGIPKTEIQHRHSPPSFAAQGRDFLALYIGSRVEAGDGRSQDMG